ncbi:MAG: alanine--tRNA ligase-related protein, partial [Candidatus Woesearchaeota archaeon]
MIEAIYLEDAYLKEFEAKVESVASGKFVILDKSAFYPKSGGQPFDTGKLIRKSDGKEFNVVFVIKVNGDISH